MYSIRYVRTERLGIQRIPVPSLDSKRSRENRGRVYLGY